VNLPKRSSFAFSVGGRISACKEVAGRTPKSVGANASEAGVTMAKKNAAATNFIVVGNNEKMLTGGT
jgi:hypothetical protein